MFEIVGNSATQIYNKEISLSLSLSSENLVVFPVDVNTKFPLMDERGIRYQKECYPLQFPTWPVASLPHHLPHLQYFPGLHSCLPLLHLSLSVF